MAKTLPLNIALPVCFTCCGLKRKVKVNDTLDCHRKSSSIYYIRDAQNVGVMFGCYLDLYSGLL